MAYSNVSGRIVRKHEWIFEFTQFFIIFLPYLVLSLIFEKNPVRLTKKCNWSSLERGSDICSFPSKDLNFVWYLPEVTPLFLMMLLLASTMIWNSDRSWRLLCQSNPSLLWRRLEMIRFLRPWRSWENVRLILHVDSPHLEPNVPLGNYIFSAVWSLTCWSERVNAPLINRNDLS